MHTLRNGVKPNFGGSRARSNNHDIGDKPTINVDAIELGFENIKEDSSKNVGMNKSSSAVPFLSAEEISDSNELYPDLSKDMNNTRVI